MKETSSLPTDNSADNLGENINMSSRKTLVRPRSRRTVARLDSAGKLPRSVKLGHTVYLKHGNSLQAYVVTEVAGVDNPENVVSVSSPLGRSLLGKHEGDMVYVNAPFGRFRFTIDRIE